MLTDNQTVARITDLKSTIMYFAGTTLSNSIAQAEAWGRERGWTLSKYYIQVAHGGRSIIASFVDARAETEIQQNRGILL